MNPLTATLLCMGVIIATILIVRALAYRGDCK